MFHWWAKADLASKEKYEIDFLCISTQNFKQRYSEIKVYSTQ